MKKNIMRLINTALTEDRARQDITSRILVPAGQRGEAVIRSKEEAVVCGTDIARQIFRRLDPSARIEIKKKDGHRIRKNEIILRVRGKVRSILAAERTVLNFLGRLSGIATQTARFAKVAPRTAIMDTRKTTPGLRVLEKYAVRCGGGRNHRLNLADMVMIKDNHRTACTGIAEAVAKVKTRTSKPVIVEADTLAQFKEALGARPDVILLDNMRPAQIKAAVAYKKRCRQKTELEVSGNIDLRKASVLGKAGVDRISVGALTHSVKNIDFSLELKAG